MTEPPGPTLRTYVETRFNLLTESVEMRLQEMELRHQQRWDASQQAITLGFAGQKSAVDAALAAADRAVSKAELATERRFEGVNEFRKTLDDQQRTLMPRAEVEVMRDAMGDRLTALKEVVDRLQAERQGVVGGWGYAVGAIGFVLTLVMIGLRVAGK